MKTSPAASEYLVNYGRTACVGRFRAPQFNAFAYGDRVIVQSPRGIEIGSVLSESPERFARLVGDAPLGEVLRPVNPDDLQREAIAELRAQTVLADIQTVAENDGLPVSILDLEILHDDRTAIIHVLPLGDCDLTNLIQALSEKHGLLLVILDLRTKKEVEPPGCGKPGCGSAEGGCSTCSTGGGCSTGNCSSGKVKNADEMTAYFSGLRQQLENRVARVPLHG